VSWLAVSLGIRKCVDDYGGYSTWMWSGCCISSIGSMMSSYKRCFRDLRLSEPRCPLVVCGSGGLWVIDVSSLYIGYFELLLWILRDDSVLCGGCSSRNQ
jgi:hypothetical protein